MKNPRILVLYASTDGQTARIAERVGGVLSAAGCGVTLRSADALEAIWEIDTHDAVIVGGGVRYGKHPPYLVERVRDSLALITARPNAFFSVSLSAGGPGARPAEATRIIDRFIERTGWQPQECASFAGALRYSRYNAFIRFMMRCIVGMAGGDTDTSRDYEYTDWEAVERFAAAFARRLAPPELAQAA
jgi:menaquinone-dependent protoporphyrinogen oxidase